MKSLHLDLINLQGVEKKYRAEYNHRSDGCGLLFGIDEVYVIMKETLRKKLFEKNRDEFGRSEDAINLKLFNV